MRAEWLPAAAPVMLKIRAPREVPPPQRQLAAWRRAIRVICQQRS
jgi:hypothetical protein